eukprot:6456753-Amphidinium_carterae.1
MARRARTAIPKVYKSNAQKGEIPNALARKMAVNSPTTVLIVLCCAQQRRGGQPGGANCCAAAAWLHRCVRIAATTRKMAATWANRAPRTRG